MTKPSEARADGLLYRNQHPAGPDRSVKKNRDFRLAYRQGRSAVSSLLVLYARPNGLPDNRLGITAGRKVGKAVIRNRVKRLIRENFRLIEPRLAQGYDLIFVARGAAGALSKPGAFHEIGRAMRYLLMKQELLAP